MPVIPSSRRQRCDNDRRRCRAVGRARRHVHRSAAAEAVPDYRYFYWIVLIILLCREETAERRARAEQGKKLAETSAPAARVASRPRPNGKDLRVQLTATPRRHPLALCLESFAGYWLAIAGRQPLSRASALAERVRSAS
jgi:hypothetical protein